MRRVIHKQELPLTGEFRMTIPQNAKILCVQTQYNPKVAEERPYVWYSFHPNDYQNTYWHEFVIAATGHEFNVPSDDKYVGTFSLYQGEFIGHLYHLGAKEAVFDG